MAIATVQAFLNGTWHTLTYNSGTGKYEATITAPGTSSWSQPDHVYAMQVRATNTANTTTTVDTSDAAVGNDLKLRVLETVKPTINITSPGAGSYVTNSQQPIVFQLRDESGGSGISLSTLALKIDGGAAIGSGGAGMVCNAVSNGYDCTYTPPTALSDGSHTVTIADGFLTNTASLTVQGTTNDNTSSPVTVTIKLNGVDQGAVTVTGGAFTKVLTLVEGANTIVVRSTDAAGKYSEVTITGTLDTSAPIISSVTITPNPANTGQTMLIQVEVMG
jgi:hypothetical protein